MSDEQQAASWAGYGEITKEEDLLTWRPVSWVALHATPEFELQLKEVSSGEMRLIKPADGFYAKEEGGRVGPGAFIYYAHIGGLAVLIARELSPEGRRRHDTAYMHVERLRHSSTWIKRQFNGPRDFKISRQMQSVSGITSAVPAAFNGREMQVKDLMEVGNELAAERGIDTPSPRDAVHLGLYAAARQDPLLAETLSPEEILKIVRSALLDLDRAPLGVSDEILQMVTDRFANRVEPHLDDETPNFQDWLHGPKNSLVRQIANQKKSPGGVLDQKAVTAALDELGWRCLLHAGLCIETQMRCVAADLSEPLSLVDQQRYENIYFRQPWLAGLPLCLFAERFQFLSEAIWDLIEQPSSPPARGTVLRMLQYYASAVSQRRELDRERKQRGRG